MLSIGSATGIARSSVRLMITSRGERTGGIRALRPNDQMSHVAPADGAWGSAIAFRRPRTPSPILTLLLSSVVVALGATNAVPAARHNDAPAHRNKAVKAERHQHGSTSKRALPVSRHERNRAANTGGSSVPLPIERPAVLSLPPDLAATKQAI